MVCVDEFCKHPAWYRLGTEVAAVESHRERVLQEVFSTPAVVTTELESSCACFVIGLACFVLFVICLWTIKSKFEQVCSKCGGRVVCQGLRSLEQLLVKVRTIEQRMGALEEFQLSTCLPKRAGHTQETGTKGKVCEQLTRASLDKPVPKEEQTD